MNVGSCFSGIGGIDLGLERAGHKILWQCEADAYRREVLKRHWPGIPCYEDVCSIRLAAGEPGCESPPDSGDDPQGRFARRVDLLVGGFPCQNLSVAGKRAGLHGDRSGLFFEFARIADAIRPEWLLIENVPGLLSSNGGRDFGELLGTLADIGYGVGWRTLDSRFFGVPQRRRRVFILANIAGGRIGAERCGEVLSVGSGCEGHPAAGRETGPRVAASLSRGSASSGVSVPGRRQEDDVNLVAHTLRGEGFDASEDGTGRGTPLVAGPVTKRQGKGPNTTLDDGALVTEREREIVNALDSNQGGPDDNSAQAGHLITEKRSQA